MSNDKLRDAVEDALQLANTQGAAKYLPDIIKILEKALKPEQEFYPGQHVIITSYKQPCKCIVLRQRGVDYLVYKKDDDMANWVGSVKMIPDPDWSPPGYIKNPGYDNIEMEVKKEIDYWFENTERNFWELSDLITNKVFSLWPDESEGE